MPSRLSFQFRSSVYFIYYTIECYFYRKKRSRKKSKKRKTKIYLSIFAKPEGERSSDGGPPDPYIPRYIHLTDKTRFDDQRLPRHVLEDDSRWYCHPVERSNIRLNDAVKHSDMDSLMFSLKHRKDIAHMRDNYNKTALMAAAYDGNMDMVKFLVDKGWVVWFRAEV